MKRFSMLIGLVVALSGGVGCTPVSVTFTLGDRPGAIDRSAVMTEGDAPARRKVALIDVGGVITDAPRTGLLSSGPNPVDDLQAKLNRAACESDVKAVVLRINSPGGSVTASDIMYDSIRRFREESDKPVVALYGEIAASGGYYISLAADEIVTPPTTITGSIGVIFPTFNVSGGMQRLGIESRAVTSGPNKDIASPVEPMDESHYEIIEGMVAEMYDRFRSLVLDRRPAFASGGRVDEGTDGRIMTGSQAVRLRLADHEGDVRFAFTRAMDLASLESATLMKYHKRGQKARTPYSRSAGTVPSAEPAPILRVPGLDQLGSLPTGMYYLWVPGTR